MLALMQMILMTLTSDSNTSKKITVMTTKESRGGIWDYSDYFQVMNMMSD